MSAIDQEYINEKKAAVKEFEEKKVELKENLILELEEKKRMVDGERHSMELTGGLFYTLYPQDNGKFNIFCYYQLSICGK